MFQVLRTQFTSAIDSYYIFLLDQPLARPAKPPVLPQNPKLRVIWESLDPARRLLCRQSDRDMTWSLHKIFPKSLRPPSVRTPSLSGTNAGVTCHLTPLLLTGRGWREAGCRRAGGDYSSMWGVQGCPEGR